MKRCTLAIGITGNELRGLCERLGADGCIQESWPRLFAPQDSCRVKKLKSSISGIDIEFPSESNTGSRLVEMLIA